MASRQWRELKGGGFALADENGGCQFLAGVRLKSSSCPVRKIEVHGIAAGGIEIGEQYFTPAALVFLPSQVFVSPPDAPSL